MDDSDRKDTRMQYSMVIEWSAEDDMRHAAGKLWHRDELGGASYAEAVSQGEDAIATWIETARAWGDPIPPPRVHSRR